MEVLLVPLSNLFFLPCLFILECKHPTVHFQKKEMQEQRHEVCLKYIGSGSGASSRWPSSFGRNWAHSALLEGWNSGKKMESWNGGILE